MQRCPPSLFNRETPYFVKYFVHFDTHIWQPPYFWQVLCHWSCIYFLKPPYFSFESSLFFWMLMDHYWHLYSMACFRDIYCDNWLFHVKIVMYLLIAFSDISAKFNSFACTLGNSAVLSLHAIGGTEFVIAKWRQYILGVYISLFVIWLAKFVIIKTLRVKYQYGGMNRHVHWLPLLAYLRIKIPNKDLGTLCHNSSLLF